MDSWLADQRRLLEVEQEESARRHRPESVGKLRLASCKIGAFGRATLVLTRDNAIPAELTNGTPVKLTCPRWGAADDAQGKQGLVRRVLSDNEVEVACKEGELASHEHDITLTTLPDDTSLARVNKALASAAKTRFADILFGDAHPRFDNTAAVASAASASPLNSAQELALGRALAARDVAVIWGPPGTGKTHTLARLLEALLLRDPTARVLCVAPSNVAVDNLLAAFLRTTGSSSSSSSNSKRTTTSSIPKDAIVRIGHPSRVDPELQAYTLDSILARSDVAALVLDAQNELVTTRDKQRKAELRREIKTREQAFVRELLTSRCRLVMSTISSSAQVDKLLHKGGAGGASPFPGFSHLVVDECGQAIEASVWVPMQLLQAQTGVLILAGDHKQLPPTVLSQDAAQQGLGRTMMDRVMARRRECAVMLLEQYRMCDEIMAWSGREMYEGRLVAHSSVKARRLADVLPPASKDEDNLLGPLLFIDTAGCDLNESSSSDDHDATNSSSSSSRSNTGEAQLVVHHVARLLNRGLPAAQIAVISPYKAQVVLLKDMLPPAIEVRSVDGFQGQERDAVVISMVRSNTNRDVGFLQDERRLNVAITRAKRHVCLIGNSATLESHGVLKSLLAHFEREGEVRSAVEFVAAAAAATGDRREPVKAVAAAKGKKDAAVIKPFAAAKAPPAATIVSKPPPPPAVAKPVHFSVPLEQTAEKKLQGFSKLAVAATSNTTSSDDDSEEEEDAAVVPPPAPRPAPPTKPPSSSSSSKAPIKPTPTSAAAVTKKKKTQDAVADDDNDDDEDAFLDALVQNANKCVMEGCTTQTTLIGHDCSFCKERFCLKHRQPELHGCGKQARRTAKQANYSKAPPMKPTERAKLQAKLNAKIGKEESDRTSKPKPKPK